MNTRARAFPTLRRITEYEGVAEITGRTPGRASWDDDEIMAEPGIKLPVLTDAEMIREVKIFVHGVTTKMTPRSVASALLLTWNMRATDPLESRIFPDADEGVDPEDKPVSDLEVEGEEYTDPTIDAALDTLNGFEVRRAGAFLAASTLKMFAKPASSWVLAMTNNHFAKRYMTFNKVEFPFGVTVNSDQIDIMQQTYTSHRLYLSTLGRILYSLAIVKDTRQTEMLFEQHLSCSGMHIVPQFIQAKISLGAPTSDLLCAIDYGSNRPNLVVLRDLINTSLSRPASAENRATWRFSRLFDQGAYAALQSKPIADTVAILAYINKFSQATNTFSDPLNIAVVRQLGPERLRTARKTARNIFHYFTVTSRATANPFFDIDTYNPDEDEDEMDNQDGGGD